MSQEIWRENVECVYRVYDAITRRDVDAFVSETHPEVEGISYVLFEGKTFRGHEGMREFAHELITVIDWKGEVLEATPYGNGIVVATARLSGTVRGVAVSQIAYQTIRFREGKVIWFCGTGSREEALEAVGLSE